MDVRDPQAHDLKCHFRKEALQGEHIDFTQPTAYARLTQDACFCRSITQFLTVTQKCTGEKGLLCLNSFKENRIRKITPTRHLPSSMDFKKCHSLRHIIKQLIHLTPASLLFYLLFLEPVLCKPKLDVCKWNLHAGPECLSSSHPDAFFVDADVWGTGDTFPHIQNPEAGWE